MVVVYIYESSLALFQLRLGKTVSKLSCTSLMLEGCGSHILHLRSVSQLIVATTLTRLRPILLLRIVALSEILIKQFLLLDKASPLQHYFRQYRVLIPVHLHVCDFSEPVKHSLLQPPLIVVVCNFIELIGL